MYLIIFDANDSMTSSRAYEVFHDRVDVTRLRTFGEENVCWRREGPTEKRRFAGEGPDGEGLFEKVLSKKALRRRPFEEGLSEKVRPRRGLPKRGLPKKRAWQKLIPWL